MIGLYDCFPFILRLHLLLQLLLLPSTLSDGQEQAGNQQDSKDLPHAKYNNDLNLLIDVTYKAIKRIINIPTIKLIQTHNHIC